MNKCKHWINPDTDFPAPSYCECAGILPEEKWTEAEVIQIRKLWGTYPWIKVKDKLPPDRDDYIIGNDINQCVSVGWYNAEHNNGEGIWIKRTVHFDGDVTHWMLFPAPPFKEK